MNSVLISPISIIKNRGETSPDTFYAMARLSVCSKLS